MVSLLLNASPRDGFEKWACTGKPLPAPLRRAFAGELPVGKGDNCLLTLDFAFIDLAFSRLLA
jgi:hypothetical protein